MTPTFEDKERGVQLYLGDCLEILPMLTGIDAVVTDPPYGVNGQQNSKTCQRLAGQKNDYNGFKDSLDYAKRVGQSVVLWSISNGIRCVLTPGNKAVCGYPTPDSFGSFFQPASVGLQPWGRADSQPILYYGKSPHGGRQLLCQKCSWQLTEPPSTNEHPCAKPLVAWTRVLLSASLQSEWVLDPFMGSGTTGIACLRTGRRFIGIEIDPTYYKIAEDRIKRELAQGVLL